MKNTSYFALIIIAFLLTSGCSGIGSKTPNVIFEDAIQPVYLSVSFNGDKMVFDPWEVARMEEIIEIIELSSQFEHVETDFPRYPLALKINASIKQSKSERFLRFFNVLFMVASLGIIPLYEPGTLTMDYRLYYNAKQFYQLTIDQPYRASVSLYNLFDESPKESLARNISKFFKKIREDEILIKRKVSRYSS